MSEQDLNGIVQQPVSDNRLDTVDYENTVVVPPQEVNDDIITITIKDDELPDAVLKAVLMGLAEEQNAIRNVRIQKEKEKKDVTRLSLSRGQLLKYMSETIIQRQALIGGSGDLDLKGPKFREIIKMFLGVIADTFDEVKIPMEFKDMFFHALGKNLEGWESRAEKIMKTVRC
ncbi:MAG: hypothetical protein IMZ64_04385 [Bacteroidetes bacterium]|nr:hypothetical protein [Bacteroidota bacterium]